MSEEIELDDGVYNILAIKENEGVHLLDTGDSAEVYLSMEHFDQVAKLMGYQPTGKD